jgi:hypothetical protein
MNTAQTTRHQLTETEAVKGAIVYKGNGKVAMRIITVGRFTDNGPLFVAAVKATTPDRPGLRSSAQRAELYTIESA